MRGFGFATVCRIVRCGVLVVLLLTGLVVLDGFSVERTSLIVGTFDADCVCHAVALGNGDDSVLFSDSGDATGAC